MDPADEAGGEVVYASDGFSPTPIRRPPSIPSQSVYSNDEMNNYNAETVLDSEEVSPQRAFEVFNGKVYSVQTMAKTTPIDRKETPLEKLARLQAEVDELEAHLKTTTAGSGQEFDQQLVSLAKTLKSRLTAASTTKILEHDDLTRMVRQQLKLLQQQTPEEKAASAAASETSNGGVVYELYGNAANPTTMMEARLLKLERLLGSSTATHKTLVHRLEELESLVKTVDQSALEQTATKAKVIRADLEAASKARNKLTATYKKEDSKMIHQLHQQMSELEGLSAHLPALVERLQQLAGLHVQASTFSTRLEEMEKSANQLGAAVSQLEGSMGQLQTSLVTNVETMEKNMAALDERLEKL